MVLINTRSIIKVTSSSGSPVASFVDVVKCPRVGVLSGNEPSTK
jgi:hypothetical protein